MSTPEIVKRWPILHGLLLCGVSLLSACHYNTVNTTYAEADPSSHMIEIRDFKFSEQALNVLPGDSITWTNLDITPHTATALDMSWTSPELKNGESYTMLITADTSADYYCTYHPSMVAALEIATN